MLVIKKSFIGELFKSIKYLELLLDDFKFSSMNEIGLYS